MASFQEFFSVVAFFIFLRETLEASVIIAVLLQCMNRTCPRLKRQVWWGAITGIVASIVAGGVFAAVYYLAQAKLFQGNGKLIFQGCISYLACILITYLGFAMMRFGNLEQKYMRKLDGAARAAMEKATDGAPSRGHAWSVFILAASAVLREGIESIIFLAGVGSNTSFKALPLACLAGLLVGLAVGFAIYYGGRSIRDLKVFFIISTVVLFFIAAGQVSLGTQLLSKVGMFGPYAAWADELSWQYRPVVDLNGCCSDEFSHGKQFFVLAHAVVGYQSRPTPVIIILYVAYWVAVGTAVAVKWRNGSLFDADYKRKRALLRLTRRAAALARAEARAGRRAARLGAAADAAERAGAAEAAGRRALADRAAAERDAARARAEAAAAERDAEALRLEDEDAALEAAEHGGDDQALPAPHGGGARRDSDAGGSSCGSGETPPAASAIIGELDAGGKDVELGGGVLGPDQRGGGGKGGWLSKLRRKQ